MITVSVNPSTPLDTSSPLGILSISSFYFSKSTIALLGISVYLVLPLLDLTTLKFPVMNVNPSKVKSNGEV